MTIEPGKIIDLISTKQTQYYVLWAGYTTVQFTAGSFGAKETLSHLVVYAVLAGVWMFNIGHLGFVLKCVEQLNKLTIALEAALRDNKQEFETAMKSALSDMGVGLYFWRTFGATRGHSSYFMNSLVHFWIDICASAALLWRAGMLPYAS